MCLQHFFLLWLDFVGNLRFDRHGMRVFDLDQVVTTLLAQKRKQDYFGRDEDPPKAKLVKREGGRRLQQQCLEDYSAEMVSSSVTQKPQVVAPEKSQGEASSDQVRTSVFTRLREPTKAVRTLFLRDSLVGARPTPFYTLTSPYTLRSLLSYIRRDYESRPAKLALLEELLQYHRHKRERRLEQAEQEPCQIHPIDYTYLKPSLVERVNHLLCSNFWPGIDVSECNQYPDFTIVAMYKLMVVGCAFMNPEESYITYIAVHPEWRRAGIAKFMMYHLIQTSPSRDILLHVSATNPAMLLYQQLGFKPEEFIVNFYKKYYPDDSPECKHALLMRLRR
jgi:ribosomal protein S18 acetylase RimI-like enzyme